MGFCYYALFTALLASGVSPTVGKDHSLLVRNGYPVKAFRCSSAGVRPHIWKAFRVEENGLGESIDMTGFISEDAAVSFLVNTSTNTGYYLCVNTFNEDEIYDKFVVLTDGERLQASPSSVVWVNGTWSVTITIMFTQFEGTPEVPKTFYVYLWPESALESERLKFAPILESRIENGVASLSFNTNANGTITAEAEFTVGLDGRSYTVTSNPVGLILEPDPNVPDTDTIEKQGVPEPSYLSPGAVAGIVCCVLFVVAFSLYIGLCVATGFRAHYVLRRRAGQRLDNNDNMGIAVEEEHGLDERNPNAHFP